jgi:hypothetical protein
LVPEATGPAGSDGVNVNVKVLDPTVSAVDTLAVVNPDPVNDASTS